PLAIRRSTLRRDDRRLSCVPARAERRRDPGAALTLEIGRRRGRRRRLVAGFLRYGPQRPTLPAWLVCRHSRRHHGVRERARERRPTDRTTPPPERVPCRCAAVAAGSLPR